MLPLEQRPAYQDGNGRLVIPPGEIGSVPRIIEDTLRAKVAGIDAEESRRDIEAIRRIVNDFGDVVQGLIVDYDPKTHSLDVGIVVSQADPVWDNVVTQDERLVRDIGAARVTAFMVDPADPYWRFPRRGLERVCNAILPRTATTVVPNPQPV
ncbi:MAG: hypothetical protein Q7S60_01320 [bacterium]|nr:hypothetical protein [bacterium]